MASANGEKRASIHQFIIFIAYYNNSCQINEHHKKRSLLWTIHNINIKARAYSHQSRRNSINAEELFCPSIQILYAVTTQMKVSLRHNSNVYGVCCQGQHVEWQLKWWPLHYLNWHQMFPDHNTNYIQYTTIYLVVLQITIH